MQHCTVTQRSANQSRLWKSSNVLQLIKYNTNSFEVTKSHSRVIQRSLLIIQRIVQIIQCRRNYFV